MQNQIDPIRLQQWNNLWMQEAHPVRDVRVSDYTNGEERIIQSYFAKYP